MIYRVMRSGSMFAAHRSTPVYLYCAVGGRAEVARQRLLAMDFRNVSNVGGLEDARRLRGELDKLAAGQ
jgi:rhodanese-related sulfurtransferase